MVNGATQRAQAGATRAGRSLTNAKRRAILAGGAAAFLEYGFDSTSMDEVARRAGVSKATVYRYFLDKEALFGGVITDVCERIVDDQLAALMHDLPPDEALRAFGHRVLGTLFAPETIELHRIVVAECKRFPRLATLFYDSGPRGSITVLADYLRRHATDRRLKFDDPRRAAEEYLEILRGYTHLRLLLGIERSCPEDELDERVNRATVQLLAPPSARRHRRT